MIKTARPKPHDKNSASPRVMTSVARWRLGDFSGGLGSRGRGCVARWIYRGGRFGLVGRGHHCTVPVTAITPAVFRPSTAAVILAFVMPMACLKSVKPEGVATFSGAPVA